MNIEANTTKIEQYIDDYSKQHGEDYYMAFKDAHLSYITSAARHTDPRMARIEDFVNNLEEYIRITFYEKPLIPGAFPSLEGLISGVSSFKSEASKYLVYIYKHYDVNDVLPSHVNDVLRICNELVFCFNEILRIASDLDMPAEYSQCRLCLYSGDIKGLVKQVNLILASIPYSVFKQNVNESFFQVCLVLLLTLLGFKVYAEEATSKGRIDATIVINHTAYIFEFKYSKSGRNLSNTALKQIIEKNYADKYHLYSTVINAIGVSFSAKTRDINGFTVKTVKAG